MRLRKKEWSSEVFETFADYTVTEFETIKGNWKEALGSELLHLEIGSGKGDYWHQFIGPLSRSWYCCDGA
ncbi:hypothetical protein [Erysipelothrix piscisicarius]|uniref:hypothetical protein n=1 Tax=Erysipelothrix piscisicarius TaxID=2485784 RepID=UPI002F94FE5A